MRNTIKSLGNRNFGLRLGFLIVLNLGLGSLVMNFYPDIYPRFALLSFKFFFYPLRPVHGWFYLLLLVFILFGINISICSVQAFFRLVKTNGSRRRQIAALLCHLSIILALAAHLYEALAGAGSQMAIGSQTKYLPGIGRVKTESVSRSTYPDGSLKDTVALLSFNLSDGSVIRKKVSYNQPAVFNQGKDQVIILDGQRKPIGLMLADSERKRKLRLKLGSPVSLSGGVLMLRRIFLTAHNVPFAAITWRARNQAAKIFYLALDRRLKEHGQIIAAKHVYTFEKTLQEAVIYAMVRHNPSIPFILASVVLLVAGCMLLVGTGRS